MNAWASSDTRPERDPQPLSTYFRQAEARRRLRALLRERYPRATPLTIDRPCPSCGALHDTADSQMCPGCARELEVRR